MPPKKSKKRKEPAAEHRDDESEYDFKHDASEDAARVRVRRIDERKLARRTAAAERAGPCCAFSV